jgi:hypothetical protein
MKHLIIEGPDRVGKDTLIKNLLSKFSNVAIRHFRSPKGDNDLQKKQYQQLSFHGEYLTANRLSSMDFDLCVWNRGHLGEFVYGNLYRNTQPEEWVLEQEKAHLNTDETYLLLLTASPEFLASKDDGLSFASTPQARKSEIENFRKACQNSSISNFLEIQVEQDGKYLSPEEITETVYNFLQNKI